jgi:hypothetical protein
METGSLSEVSELQERVAQLQTALETRIVVEQAKGILAERFHLTVDDAFLLLRYAARSSRTNLHELARELVGARATPRSVTIAMARQQRWRAAAQRERSEAQRARAEELTAKLRAAKTRPATT